MYFCKCTRNMDAHARAQGGCSCAASPLRVGNGVLQAPGRLGEAAPVVVVLVVVGVARVSVASSGAPHVVAGPALNGSHLPAGQGATQVAVQVRGIRARRAAVAALGRR